MLAPLEIRILEANYGPRWCGNFKVLSQDEGWAGFFKISTLLSLINTYRMIGRIHPADITFNYDIFFRRKC